MGKGKGERKMETEHSREKTGVDIDITQRLKWLGNKGPLWDWRVDLIQAEVPENKQVGAREG